MLHFSICLTETYEVKTGNRYRNRKQRSEIKFYRRVFSSITEMEVPALCNIEPVVCTRVDESFAKELEFM